MPSVVCGDWSGGINLKRDAWKLAPNEWQAIENANVRNGRAEPLGGLGDAVATIGTGALAWIYRLGAIWMGSTVRRFTVDWQSEYIAYLDETGGQPKWTNGSTTVNLGLARPSLTPAVTTSAGVITGSSLSWVFTYYDGMGQESGPSPVSALTNLTAQNATVTLSVSADPAVVGRKLYRVNNGTYQLAKTITDNTATSVLDNTATLDLGDPLLTEDANGAPALSGLAIGQHQARLWGWSANRLYYTNVGTPWAWSYAYITLPANVVAAAPTPGGLLVLTTERAYLVTGYNEDTFALQSPMNTYGCAAPFSLVRTDAGLAWWDNQGLVLFDGSQFSLLTDGAFASTDIAGFDTAGMTAAYADGYYHLFHDAGVLLCDMRGGVSFSTATVTATAAFVDPAGVLYVGSGATVKPWGEGSPLVMRLRTRQFAYENLRRPFHARRADVFTTGAEGVTPQWYRQGDTWGGYLASAVVNGVAPCWSRPGNRGRPDFEVWSMGTINQIEINPERR